MYSSFATFAVIRSLLLYMINDNENKIVHAAISTRYHIWERVEDTCYHI